MEAGGLTVENASATLRASVIICTYNRDALLRNSICSVLQQDFPSHLYEIVVVDNNCSDNTSRSVEELAANSLVRIRYVFEGNQGLSLARNAGVNTSRGEVIVFTDDDVEADKRWLRELVAVFNDPAVSCAGGPIRPMWPFPRPDWLTERWEKYFTISEFRSARETGEFSGPYYPWGANIAFRKKIFKSVGMFPTNLGRVGKCLLSSEETYLCREIEARGGRIAYAHDAIIHHKIDPSRMSKLWLYHRAYWQGRSNAVSDMNIGKAIYEELHERIATLRKVTASQNISDVDRKCIKKEILGYIHQLIESYPMKRHGETIGSKQTAKTVLKALAVR